MQRPWKPADGTGEAEQIASDPERPLFPLSWSGDGNILVLENVSLSPSLHSNIGMLLMEGEREWIPLLQDEHDEDDSRISPDGRWMAYVCDESGQSEVYVRPFPDVNKGKWQLSKSEGQNPLWSPDGRELLYRGPDGYMSVSVETEPTLKLDTPKNLFTGRYLAAWDIHPDGKRFLMIKKLETTVDESTEESEPERPRKP